MKLIWFYRLGLLVLLQLLLPLGPSSATDWPMGRGNSAGTAASPDPLPQAPELLWEVDVDGLGFDAGPIIAAGMVFAADHDGRVLALDVTDGREVWRQQLDTGFVASPAYRDGVLYVGDYDGTLHALDAKTGQPQWKFASEMEIDASPNFFQDLVLFTSQNGSLYALHRDSGTLAWKYETGDQLQCGPTLAGTKTFLGGCDTNLHVVDVQNGSSIAQPLPLDAPTGSTPSVLGEQVFVPTYAGEIFSFHAPTMELLWRFQNSELSDEFKNSVAVSDGVLVASSRNKRVFALDTHSGELLWQQTLRKRADASPVIAGSDVVIAAADGRILLFDLKTGKQKWMFEVKPGFIGSPAVADGKLVVANDRGTIFCFGQSEPPPSR